jgi:hypothetical protein
MAKEIFGENIGSVICFFMFLGLFGWLLIRRRRCSVCSAKHVELECVRMILLLYQWNEGWISLQ